MLLRPILALTLLGAFGGAASAAGVTPASAAPDSREVRAWLTRIHEAASKQNFQGTFVVSGGGAVASARIAHYGEGRNQYERIESLDGQTRYVFRHNDLVHTLWPASRVALVEQAQSMTGFPALLQGSIDRIADYYEVRPQGSERVAGREAHVLFVQPRDDHRFGYRLWSDQASGLLLRSEVINERNEVLETSAFSEVTIGVKPQFESVTGPMRKLDGYRVIRPALTSTRMEAEGWAMRQLVPGFREVSCVRRPMESPTSDIQEAIADLVLQTIFSDGLTYVSVFIEPFNAQRHQRSMRTAVGATQTLMRRQGDWWITVIGDVPPATLLMFANGLERRK
ncbi:MucB/RseB C-terminal domain-containing protein [uncultured Piscinibacter sp.]|uniref:MucB/RseB C-terminal domain-containing protein n=1 Tax=uncultured Piscinibacter sp. TaxID=1131835 RepID=UPI002616BEEF|nr:MucB/RseB C-terminal domain-containing protein [uncultured Piscinibacter sp.]